jgi:hypothetical protein
MSEHEIEDIVEFSVRVIGAARSIDTRTARDLIANLYRYQTHFDCGHTQGRVRDILLQSRFLLEMPLREHLDVKKFAALFDHVEGTGQWCSLHEARREDGAQGLYAFVSGRSFVAWGPTDLISVRSRRGLEVEEDAGVYYQPPNMQLEAGSRLWRRWVERGRFSGIDADRPARMAAHQVAARVVSEAEPQDEREVISRWYALLPAFLERVGEPPEVSHLAHDPEVCAMLATVERTRAYEKRFDYGSLRVPREAELGARYDREDLREFARNWFALDWSLPPPRDRIKVVFAAALALREAVKRGVPAGMALTQAIEELGEFADWSSVIGLFQYGLGYPLDRELGSRIKRVTDWSSGHPKVDLERANAELALTPDVE